VTPVRERNPLALEVLTVAFALSLWVAIGSVVLAVAEGLDEHPVRRLTVGLALVAGFAVALLARERVSATLVARPWLVVPVAAAQILLATVDQPVGGPYVAVSLTSLGVAVAVARACTVWLCVAVLLAVYLTAVLLARSPSAIVEDDAVGTVLGAAVSYPFAALFFLGLRRLVVRAVSDVTGTLEGLRQGALPVGDALDAALRGTSTPLLLAEGSPARLTPTEITTIEGLASGRNAKRLARERGVALTTVRTHIRNAKRKTRTKTIPQLVALTARADWPELDGRDR